MARVIALLLSFLIGISFTAQRGIWIVRNSLTQQSDLRLLETLHQQMGLTDVYFQVRALGRNFIPQKTSDQSLSLKEIVTFCRQHDIQFHAWINVFYIRGFGEGAQRDGPGTVWQNGHILTDPTGNVLPPSRLKKAGLEGYFVDPQAPENLRQINDLIRRLVVEYGVDGIHLDYYRYPRFPFHYSNYLRAKFLRYFFVDPARLQRFSDDYFRVFGAASLQYMRDQYEKFLQNTLTAQLNNLTKFVKNLNSNCLVTVAVKPNMQQAQKMYAQNWPDWLDRQTCDYVLLMNYTPDETEFKKNLKRAKSLNWDRRMVIGIGVYYLDALQMNRRIQLAEQAGFKGYCLFSFTSFKEKPNLLAKSQQPAVMGIKWKR